MAHHSALIMAVNQLYQEAQEADGLAAVASLCYNDATAYTLEHVNATQLQSLLQGFATRIESIAKKLEGCLTLDRYDLCDRSQAGNSHLSIATRLNGEF